MCLNKKVLIGLGAIAAVLLLLRPAWAVAALPLLILAICPLSMIFMMRGMGSHGQDGKGAACGMSGTTGKSGTATDSALDKQIADLQEEVRILRAAEAQQRTTDDDTPAHTVDFTKPDDPGPRP
ncbi:DUF2933 domain-containing protein (plasmid) [Streptomyces sp. NBC_00637]|uniref:DUF2933 domain-containing protein n=1 Tax=Streptomyces sp. NBC_00637 TaxID=2903667 RepID=UPI002F90FEB2